MNNEAAKLPEQNPQGYGPKKAKIIDIALESICFNQVEDDFLLLESFEYFKTGKMRFIGMKAKDPFYDPSWGMGELMNTLHARLNVFEPQLNELKKDYGTEIPYLCSLSHTNHNECGVDEYLMAGYFFKEGTPIPNGMDYFDIISQDIGYGTYLTNCFRRDQEKSYDKTRDIILGDGNLVPYPIGYWDAIVHTNGIPHDGSYRFGYIFPAIIKKSYETFLNEVGMKSIENK